MTTEALKARVLEYIGAKRLLITKRHLDAQVEAETAKNPLDKIEAETKAQALGEILDDILKDLEIIVKEEES